MKMDIRNTYTDEIKNIQNRLDDIEKEIDSVYLKTNMFKLRGSLEDLINKIEGGNVEMKKVEVITANNPKGLQDQLNQALETNEVVDIKYSVSLIDSNNQNGYDYSAKELHSAIVIYK